MNYLPELRSSLTSAAQREREARQPLRAAPLRWALRALPVALGVAVAAAVAILALTATRHRGSTSAPGGHAHLLSPPKPPPYPSMSPSELRLINRAARATVRHDPACSTSTKNLPLTLAGSAPRSLGSILGVLLRPAILADRLQLSGGGPGGPAREMYVNDIRRVRVIAGTSYYVIPAGNVTGVKAVPQRCGREETEALDNELACACGASSVRTHPVLAAYLRWLRYEAAHPQGVLLAQHSSTQSGTSELFLGSGYTIDDIERGAVEEWSGEPPHAVFDGLVPDGVATVSIHYPTPTSSPITVRVRDNFFALTRRHIPTLAIPTVTWKDAHGRTIKTIRGFNG